MSKLFKLLWTHKIKFISYFLAGQAFTLLALSLGKNLIGKVLNTPSLDLGFLLGVSILILLLIILAYKPSVRFWRRWRNNYSLLAIPFTYAEGVMIFILSAVLGFVLYRNLLFNGFGVSRTSAALLSILGASLLAWAALTFLDPVSLIVKIRQTEKPLPSELGLSDEPITGESQDLLARKPFVEDFYRQIADLPFPAPFVFGLYGSWGEGKTSALNLLANKLRENRDIILIEYDPWYFESTEALVRNFYSTLEEGINKVYFMPNIRRLLRKYESLLRFGLKRFGFGTDFGWLDENPIEIKKKIGKFISDIGKKIVIFIDNIDRLQPNEILSVLKLTKLQAGFANMIFVLAFDPEVIQGYLRHEVKADPTFLDKIVQEPVPLPAVEQFYIDRFLYYSDPSISYKSEIDKLFEEIGISKERVEKFDKDFRHLYESQIKKLIRTLRQAKRYVNGLRSTLPPVKNEVDLHDFFALEVIRVFYPAVYNDIWTHPWYYIPSWGFEALFSSPFTLAVNENEKYDQIKKHIEEVIKNEPHKEILLELLKTIFFVEVKNAFSASRTGHDAVASKYRVEKRITHRESFRKYFMLKVPSRELSDEEIEATIKVWNGLAETRLSKVLKETYERFQRRNMLVEFFDKLRLFLDRINPQIARRVIQSLYQNDEIFSREGREQDNSEYDRARSLILSLMNEKIDKRDVQSVVEEVIDEAKPVLALEIAVRSLSAQDLFNIRDNTNHDQVKKRLSQKLTRYYIDDNKNVFETDAQEALLILYNWADLSAQDAEKVKDYFFKLADSHPRYIGCLIEGYTLKWAETPWQPEYEPLARVYGADELYKRIQARPGQVYSTDDQSKAIDLFVRVYKGSQTGH